MRIQELGMRVRRVMATLLLLECGVLAAEESGSQSLPSGVEQITVTAQRREESVQDVPASVEVFNRTSIEALAITDIQDVIRLTPGLTELPTSSVVDTMNVSVRGIASEVGASSTGIYINDTPVQVRAIGGGLASDSVYPLVFDLERVEVLRGPQGTLFGSSSEGGALRFITPEPGAEWNAHALTELTSTEGGDNGYQFGVAGGGPLADTVGFRGSLYTEKEAGWVDLEPFTDNLLTSDVFDEDDHVNTAHNKAAMASLYWDPTDNVRITPSIMWQKQEHEGQNGSWRDFSDRKDGDFVNADLFPATVENEFYLASLNVRVGLGDVDIYSTTSYLDRTRDADRDYSFIFAGFLGGDWSGPIVPVLSRHDSPQQQFTQELRAQGQALDGRLTWVTGAFYRRLEQRSDQTIYVPDFDALTIAFFGVPAEFIFGSGLLPGGVAAFLHDDAKDTEIAGFGQVDYEVLPRLTLTVGVRVSETELEVSNVQTGMLQTGGKTSGESSGSQVDWLPKFGVKYDFDNMMVFLTASRGFRPGGSNVPLPVLCDPALASIGLSEAPSDYDSDYVWSYEVGAKGNIADNRLLWSLSGYAIDWEDLQDAVELSACGLRFISNFGSAKSRGVDLQLSAAVMENLRVGLSVAYNDGYYDETVIVGTSTQVDEDDPLAIAPWRISGTVDYTFHPFASGEAYLHLDGQYSDDYDLRTAVGGDPETDRFGNALIASARIGVRFGAWDVSVFARNLFDENNVLQANLAAGQFIDSVPTPRSWGLTARTSL